MKLSQKIYTTLIFVFLYAPIGILVLFSFNSSNSTGVFEGFSLRWYRELFQDKATLEALKNTLILAVTSSAIATVIGTAAAVGISRMKKQYLKGTLMTVTNVPMMNPDIVTGISMMLLFVFVGTLLHFDNNLSFWTLLVAHVTFNLPYVILSVLPKIKQLDSQLPEAAMDLGCTPMQAFFKVELPAIMPGVLTGAIMAFTLSLDDFVISYFNSGATFQTLPVTIYSMTKKPYSLKLNALSTLLFVVILALMLISNIKKPVNNKKAKR